MRFAAADRRTPIVKIAEVDAAKENAGRLDLFDRCQQLFAGRVQNYDDNVFGCDLHRIKQIASFSFSRNYSKISISTKAMHITRIELENIKSHIHSKFEFTRGTTAITGRNGAGKTTLIEAVAWTLFDLLEYKKDDFLRRGAKKGTVDVSFVSALDEREYRVYRDTGTGYYIFDEQIGLRVADKKEEVQRFLSLHLGVEPGTDLATLFRHAIGVPQGTFTAIFLAAASERKKTFDTLLKVEEYRRGAEALKDTQNYVKEKANVAALRISNAEGKLDAADDIEQRYKELSAAAEELRTELAVVDQAVELRSAAVTELDAAFDKISGLRTAAAEAESTARLARQIFEQRIAEAEAARVAAAAVERSTAGHEAYLTAVATIKELEEERGRRDQLRRRAAELEAKFADIGNRRTRLAIELENIRRSADQIVELEPLAAQQADVESELDALRQQVTAETAKSLRSEELSARLEQLRKDFRETQERLNEAIKAAQLADRFPLLQEQSNKMIAEMAHLNAMFERDQRFKAEISNGLCPILSAKCLNLAEGETLEAFVNARFDEYQVRLERLQKMHAELAVELEAARQAQLHSGLVDELSRQLEILKNEGLRHRDAQKEAEAAREAIAELAGKQAGLESRLKELDDPRGKLKFLRSEAAKLADVERAIKAADADAAEFLGQQKELAERIAEFAAVDEKLAAAAEQRDAAAADHRTYIANESAAARLTEVETAFAEAEKNVHAADTKRTAAEAALAEAGAEYDAAAHADARRLLNEEQQRQAALRVRCEANERETAELERRISQFAEIKKKMRADMREKEKLDRVAEATGFIRNTLKEAAPRVARNYVHHISAEANLIFREITGAAERTLRWGEDYGIFLEEDGYERPFSSLSGGEQMAAAIAIRLGLLRQLSEIRIAFFDEPTTNLDPDRRENLAMQISRITNFDQLFVISHDDTFEGYMDSELRLEPEAAAAL